MSDVPDKGKLQQNHSLTTDKGTHNTQAAQNSTRYCVPRIDELLHGNKYEVNVVGRMACPNTQQL